MVVRPGSQLLTHGTCQMHQKPDMREQYRELTYMGLALRVLGKKGPFEIPPSR